MKKRTFSALLFSFGIIALTGLVTACKDDDKRTGPPRDIVYGSEVNIGNGKARSFIKLDASGIPVTVGFTMSQAALEGLPHEVQSYELSLPAERSKTVYDHISLEWAPHGHAPDGIYSKPHFDMHFYMISQGEKAGIRQPSEEMEHLPEARFMPPTYFSQPGEGVPQMGKHWVDGTAPELQGKPFTTTFIYGSYNGEVIFHEPMMAHEWLLTRPDTLINVAQPQAFQRSGLYPEKYALKYVASRQQYEITLESLNQRP